MIKSSIVESNTPIAVKGNWSKIWKRYRNKFTAKIAAWGLVVLVFLAVFGDFIANEKPIYCEKNGKQYFPILKGYAVSLGLGNWEEQFITTEWQDQIYDYVILPPIPYSATTTDLKNANFVSPYAEQNVRSKRYHHWLGTDNLGRDVLAGLIGGVRIALLVGVISMLLATIIGLFFGSVAGFFGDDSLFVSYSRLFVNLITLPITIFLAFVINYKVLFEDLGLPSIKNGFFELFVRIAVFIFFFLIFNLFTPILKKIKWFNRTIQFPIDMLTMRLIEIIHGVPILLMILAIISIIEKPSLLYVMVIIGFLRWTNIARFIRAELLRIRSMEYIEAVKVLGLSDWEIIKKHALPNALPSALISIAFGIASSVIFEAFLSFLGIGVSVEEVTWGVLLKQARSNFSAWWLAIFPGIAIFITVTIFNLIGEGLNEALDPRHNHDNI